MVYILLWVDNKLDKILNIKLNVVQTQSFILNIFSVNRYMMYDVPVIL